MRVGCRRCGWPRSVRRPPFHHGNTPAIQVNTTVAAGASILGALSSTATTALTGPVPARCKSIVHDGCRLYVTQKPIPALSPLKGNLSCVLNCNHVGNCLATKGICQCGAGAALTRGWVWGFWRGGRRRAGEASREGGELKIRRQGSEACGRLAARAPPATRVHAPRGVTLGPRAFIPSSRPSPPPPLMRQAGRDWAAPSGGSGRA